MLAEVREPDELLGVARRADVDRERARRLVGVGVAHDDRAQPVREPEHAVAPVVLRRVLDALRGRPRPRGRRGRVARQRRRRARHRARARVAGRDERGPEALRREEGERGSGDAQQGHHGPRHATPKRRLLVAARFRKARTPYFLDPKGPSPPAWRRSFAPKWLAPTSRRCASRSRRGTTTPPRRASRRSRPPRRTTSRWRASNPSCARARAPRSRRCSPRPRARPRRRRPRRRGRPTRRATARTATTTAATARPTRTTTSPPRPPRTRRRAAPRSGSKPSSASPRARARARARARLSSIRARALSTARARAPARHAPSRARRRDRLRIAALHALRVLVRGADATAGALCSEAHTHMLIHACHSRRTAVATAALSALVNVLKVSHQRALGALGGGARPVDRRRGRRRVRARGRAAAAARRARAARDGRALRDRAAARAPPRRRARRRARRWLLSAGISAPLVSLLAWSVGRARARARARG